MSSYGTNGFSTVWLSFDPMRRATCGLRRRTHRHRSNGLDGVFDVFTGINTFEEPHIGTLVSGRNELQTAYQQGLNPDRTRMFLRS